jgi:hypothetical protein
LLAEAPSSVMTMFFTGLLTKCARQYINNINILRILSSYSYSGGLSGCHLFTIKKSCQFGL